MTHLVSQPAQPWLPSSGLWDVSPRLGVFEGLRLPGLENGQAGLAMGRRKLCRLKIPWKVGPQVPSEMLFLPGHPILGTGPGTAGTPSLTGPSAQVCVRTIQFQGLRLYSILNI